MLVAYACDLGVGVYLVPSTLTLVYSPEHRFELVVGKPLVRHVYSFALPTLLCRVGDQSNTQPLRLRQLPTRWRLLTPEITNAVGLSSGEVTESKRE